MGQYELIVIMSAALEDEACQKEIGRIEETVKNNAGEVKEVQPWGKRKLAYEIAGQREGHYTSIFFEGENRTLQEIDRTLKLNETIIRHLVLKSEGSTTAKPEE